jgi:hypothetical protein
MLQDNIVTFLQDQYRGGYLLADPEQVCTVAFLENLVEFIEAHGGERCRHCDALIADYNRQIANLQRWVRWLLPLRRGGGRP